MATAPFSSFYSPPYAYPAAAAYPPPESGFFPAHPLFHRAPPPPDPPPFSSIPAIWPPPPPAPVPGGHSTSPFSFLYSALPAYPDPIWPPPTPSPVPTTSTAPPTSWPPTEWTLLAPTSIPGADLSSFGAQAPVASANRSSVWSSSSASTTDLPAPDARDIELHVPDLRLQDAAGPSDLATDAVQRHYVEFVLDPLPSSPAVTRDTTDKVGFGSSASSTSTSPTSFIGSTSSSGITRTSTTCEYVALQILDEMPQLYDFRNLNRQSVFLADGTEHSYFTLPADYPLPQVTPPMSPSTAENIGGIAPLSVAAQIVGLAPVPYSQTNNTAGTEPILAQNLQLPTTMQDASSVFKEMLVYDIYEDDNSCLNCMDEQLATPFHKASENALSEHLLTCFSKAPETEQTSACLNIVTDVLDVNLELQQLDGEKASNCPVLKASDSVVTRSNHFSMEQSRKELRLQWDPGENTNLNSTLNTEIVGVLQTSILTTSRIFTLTYVHQLRELRWNVLITHERRKEWDPGDTKLSVLFMTAASATKLQCIDLDNPEMLQALDRKPVHDVFDCVLEQHQQLYEDERSINDCEKRHGDEILSLDIPEVKLLFTSPSKAPIDISRDAFSASQCPVIADLQYQLLGSTLCIWDPRIRPSSSMCCWLQSLTAGAVTEQPSSSLLTPVPTTCQSQVTNASYAWDPGIMLLQYSSIWLLLFTEEKIMLGLIPEQCSSWFNAMHYCQKFQKYNAMCSQLYWNQDIKFIGIPLWLINFQVP